MVTKLDTAHTMLPVRKPLGASWAGQIHTETMDATPVVALLIAAARPTVRLLGTLLVTQPTIGAALGKAPHATRKRQPYREA